MPSYNISLDLISSPRMPISSQSEQQIRGNGYRERRIITTCLRQGLHLEAKLNQSYTRISLVGPEHNISVPNFSMFCYDNQDGASADLHVRQTERVLSGVQCHILISISRTDTKKNQKTLAHTCMVPM